MSSALRRVIALMAAQQEADRPWVNPKYIAAAVVGDDTAMDIVGSAFDGHLNLQTVREARMAYMPQTVRMQAKTAYEMYRQTMHIAFPDEYPKDFEPWDQLDDRERLAWLSAVTATQ